MSARPALHHCGCRACDPDAFPSGPRQGEHHFAVRFGDGRLPIWATLDGVYVPRCTETIAGDDGLVVRVPSELRLCECGEVVEEVVRGPVRVTTERPADAPGE